MHRTPWLWVLALASCHATPAILPEDPVDPAAPQSLYATSIWFEPALPAAGTLSIAHESGWSLRCAAQPSGVDVRIPEGPASVTLRIHAETYERTIKVTRSANEIVWHWRPPWVVMANGGHATNGALEPDLQKSGWRWGALLATVFTLSRSIQEKAIWLSFSAKA